jgi:ParB-like chromosome segregation protein Spo0J
VSNDDVVDLSADLPGETAELKMLKPGTEEPNGWVITLAGPSHPKALAFKDASQRERLAKQAQLEAQQANGRKVKPDVMSPQDADLRTVKWLVSRIVSWTPIRIGAETFSFSDDAATRLLLKPEMAPYIGQIVDYLQSERAFMPTSASS